MSLHKRSGTRVTSTNYTDVSDPAPVSDPYITITEDLVHRGEFSGGDDATLATGDDMTTLAFHAGAVVRQSRLLAMLTKATVSLISPATGPIAGGTVVTIVGDGLDGLTGVTFGGTAATSVVVVDPRTVTCVAPAHAAGAVAVVLADDGGAVTVADGFTFTA